MIRSPKSRQGARPVRGPVLAGNLDDRRQQRKQALDAYLTARSADGFQLESRTDTHAIITRKGLVAGLLERVGLNGRKRQVISVDEHGTVTAQPAEPVRW